MSHGKNIYAKFIDVSIGIYTFVNLQRKDVFIWKIDYKHYTLYPDSIGEPRTVVVLNKLNI